jgi:hypothetical protein
MSPPPLLCSLATTMGCFHSKSNQASEAGGISLPHEQIEEIGLAPHTQARKTEMQVFLT